MAHSKLKFKLFISGMSVKSGRAIENIKAIGDNQLKGNYELEIIDLTKTREKAMQYQIVAIPTLIKYEPAPIRTLVGDLSDTKKVLKILEIE
ncbi:MAG: circadian clock KaiB family protein [Bacteroidota bacterium]